MKAKYEHYLGKLKIKVFSNNSEFKSKYVFLNKVFMKYLVESLLLKGTLGEA